MAQRSAQAAKEIKTLIASSSEQVRRGVQLVGETGQALDGIVNKVTEIDALIAEIALSAQEQATGLAQVNVAVNQMDQVTQQNAAMVEEATATASNLRSEALELAELVGRFAIDDLADAPSTLQAPPTQIANFRHPTARLQVRSRAAPSAKLALAGRHDWEEF